MSKTSNEGEQSGARAVRSAARREGLPSFLLLGAICLVFSCVTVWGIGDFGFWEPVEIARADIARDMVEGPLSLDTSGGTARPPRPPLPVWASALGFRLAGLNEWGGRLPFVFAGLLGLLLMFRLGERVVSRRAGVASAFVLATTPAYLLESRQLTSDIWLYVCILAAVGGIAGYLWPADQRPRRRDLVVAAFGFIGGFLAKGLVGGYVLPLAIVASVLILKSGIARSTQGLGASPIDIRRSWRPLAITFIGSGLGISVLWWNMPAGSYLIWGSAEVIAQSAPSFESSIKYLGFGVYPWFALLPVALSSFLVAGEQTNKRLAGLLAASAILVGFFVAAMAAAFVGRMRFPTMPFVALLVGAFLAQAAEEDNIRPFAAIVALGLLLGLRHDFDVTPGTLAFAHLDRMLVYPDTVSLSRVVRPVGILFAVLFSLGLVAPRTWRKIPLRRVIWVGAGGSVLLFSLWLCQGVIPSVSAHMSNKAVFETYKKCRSEGDVIVRYQKKNSADRYYLDAEPELVSAQAKMVDRLAAKERVFALIPTGALAPLDRLARRRKVAYVVLDASNSKYFVLSNALDGRCNRDKNPLRRLVSASRPKVEHKVEVNFDNRVKLIGYDLPETIRTGGKFKVTLYFEVLSQMPSRHKIFMHFDKPAGRFNGDHDPTGGTYPTEYWLPGDFISDSHEVEIPALTTAPGYYTLYAGFWRGDDRLKIISGKADGKNRARLGHVRIRPPLF